MRAATPISAVAGALALFMLAREPASTQDAANSLANSMVDIAYAEPSEAEYRPIYERLKARQVLEELRQFLAPLRLPRKVLVETKQCDKGTARYTEGGPVTICYQYIHELEKYAEKIPADARTQRGVSRDDAVVGAFVQAVLNGTSLAVFDVLEVPVWGREDDAADKLAGFLMLQFGPDIARRLLNGAAFFFEASDRTWTGSDFSDTRESEAQRFYNYLCVAYGADPKTFSDFVEADSSHQRGGPAPALRTDVLPQHRAQRCRGEYNDLQFAFNRTIMPYLDQDMLHQVLARRDWLRSNDGK
jgi:hypothetical protein